MKAIVFVDVQKDFIDGTLRNEKAIEVTPKIVEFAKECVDKGYKLYATRDTHEKTEYKEFDCTELGIEPHIDTLTGEKQTKFKKMCGYLSTLEGQNLPVEHCIEGTAGWMIDDRLMEVIDGKCTFVNKPTFGSFDLAEIIAEDWDYNACKKLHEAGRDDKLAVFDEIILCGFVTSICLLANAVLLRAKFPNMKITVMKDLCAGISDEDHSAALKCLEMQQIDVK